MKKICIIILLLVVVGGCTTENAKETELSVDKDNFKKELTQQEIDKLPTIKKELIDLIENTVVITTRNNEIEKVIEKYPDDEELKVLSYYNSALINYDFYLDAIDFNMSNPNEYLESAQADISKVSPTYNGIHSEKIISFANEILGDKWEEIRNKTIAQEEKFNNLTYEERKEIFKYITSRFEYYNAEVTGDKYSKNVWEETSEKYGISLSHVTEIWGDLDIVHDIGVENEEKNKIVGDAVLNYENGSSIIAINQDYLNKYIDAIIDNNNDLMSELINTFKVGKVPKNTPVNIIEEKTTMIKVEILDGIYKGSKAWTLREAVIKK